MDTLYRTTYPENAIEDGIEEWLVKEGAKSSPEQYKKKCIHCGAESEIVGFMHLFCQISCCSGYEVLGQRPMC